MLLGLEKVNPEDISSHHNCRLGKWYFNQKTKDRIGSSASYKAIDAPHQEVHHYAKLAAEAYTANNISLAEQHLDSLDKASEKVLTLIDELLMELEK